MLRQGFGRIQFGFCFFLTVRTRHFNTLSDSFVDFGRLIRCKKST